MTLARRGWAWGLLAGAGALGVVECAGAQPRFETLTLVDAGYLYHGLGIQAILRVNGSMKSVVVAVTVCSLLWLIMQRGVSEMPRSGMEIPMYFITNLLILTLFWPEALNLTGLRREITAGDVGSLIARQFKAQYPSPTLVTTVDEMGGMDESDYKDGLSVPMGTELFLQAAIGIPLRLGQAINDNLKNPHNDMLSKAYIIFTQVPAEIQDRLRVFVGSCYIDGLYELHKVANAEVLWQKSLPWDPDLRAILQRWDIQYDTEAREAVFVDSQFAAHARPSAGGGLYMSCYGYYQSLIEQPLERWLRVEHPQYGQHAGVSVSDALLQNLQLQATSQVRFLVSRELQRMLPPRVVSENLTTLGTTADVAAAGLLAAEGFRAVMATQKARRRGEEVEGLGHSLKGFLTGYVNQQLEGVKQFMRPAMMLLMFAPYMTGIISATALGLFPFVVIWSLFPGQHFKPLINYFLVILWSQSAPLWYGLSDMMSRIAFSSFGGTNNLFQVNHAQELVEWGTGSVAGVIVAVLTAYLVPLFQAAVMFGTWRAVGRAAKW